MAGNKLSSEKKVLILIIVLFALVAALNMTICLSSLKKFPLIVAQPTEEPTVNYNNETKNWKIYTDNKYWFQIKYPADWHFNSGANDKSQGNFLFSSNNGNEDIYLKVFEKDADISKYQDMVKIEEAVIKTNDQRNFVLWFTGASENSERWCDLELILKQMAFIFKFIEADDTRVINNCKEKIVSRESNFCYINLGKEKGLDFCDKIEDSKKPYCYASIGAAENDSSICDSLVGKNLCYGLIGGLIGNFNVCEEIKDYSCIWGLSITSSEVDVKLCEGIKDSNYKDLCYAEEALKAKDSSICKNKIENFTNKNYCYRDLAVLLQDESLCKNIPLGRCLPLYDAPRDKCYKDVAVEAGNSDICKKAICGWDYYCYYDVAKKLNDINICKKVILSEIWRTWPSENYNCFAELAISVNDIKTCKELIDKNNRDFCYWGIAEKFKDKSICDNIKEQEIKEECYRILEKN